MGLICSNFVLELTRFFLSRSVAAAEANDMQQAHEKVSILQPVHSKQQFNLHGIHDDQNIPPERSYNPTGEDGAAAAQTLGSRMVLRTHASSLSHRNSRPPSNTWATQDKENSQALQVSKSNDLLLYEVPTSLEVWDCRLLDLTCTCNACRKMARFRISLPQLTLANLQTYNGLRSEMVHVQVLLQQM